MEGGPSRQYGIKLYLSFFVKVLRHLRIQAGGSYFWTEHYYISYACEAQESTLS